MAEMREMPGLVETRRTYWNCNAKGFLDNISYEAHRNWILERYELNGVITLVKQKEYINMLRVEEGDILITRSGTIGKVTYATKDLATDYIVSDDLARIRVNDKNLRNVKA